MSTLIIAQRDQNGQEYQLKVTFRCTTLFDKEKKTESVLVKALAGSALKNPNMMVTSIIFMIINIIMSTMIIIISLKLLPNYYGIIPKLWGLSSASPFSVSASVSIMSIIIINHNQ